MTVTINKQQSLVYKELGIKLNHIDVTSIKFLITLFSDKAPALRGVFSLNPKITKLLAEREKNSEKIAKLNARNDEIDKQVTELENLDIVALSGAWA